MLHNSHNGTFNINYTYLPGRVYLWIVVNCSAEVRGPISTLNTSSLDGRSVVTKQCVVAASLQSNTEVQDPRLYCNTFTYMHVHVIYTTASRELSHRNNGLGLHAYFGCGWPANGTTRDPDCPYLALLLISAVGCSNNLGLTLVL